MKNELVKIAISVGELNGIGLELILKSHKILSKICKPYYFIHYNLLEQACKKLAFKLPENFCIIEFQNAQKTNFYSKNDDKKLKIYGFDTKLTKDCELDFKIQPGLIDKKSGLYSFLSFESATNFVRANFAQALITLPIHKKAWLEAGLEYKGHTRALSAFFHQEALMMLGCSKLFVALFTEHLPLSKVSACIHTAKLCEFFIRFYESTYFKNIRILGFNPHASDFGSIGGAEERKMSEAIEIVNLYLSFKSLNHKQKNKILTLLKLENEDFLLEKLLQEPQIRALLTQKCKIKAIYNPQILSADTAFTPKSLKKNKVFVSMYHDQALTPLKALYFEKSVNISLNLPIIRTSVDHGTAFDIAYKNKASAKNYKAAVKMALQLVQKKNKAFKYSKSEFKLQ